MDFGEFILRGHSRPVVGGCDDRLFSVLPELSCDQHGHFPVPHPNRSMRSLAVTYCSKLLTSPIEK